VREPTSEEVATFYRQMEARFGFRLVDKRASSGMRALADLLAPSIPVADFLSRYATTIGEVVYVPFLPGQVLDVWPPWSQVRILVHEVAHVEQHRADPLFPARYLLSPGHRAIYEAQALAAGWQIDGWRGVQHPPPGEQVRVLRAYSLTDETLAAALAVLESAAVTLAAGGLVSTVATFASTILPPDVRAKTAPPPSASTEGEG
jgi:hypothetical protein